MAGACLWCIAICWPYRHKCGLHHHCLWFAHVCAYRLCDLVSTPRSCSLGPRFNPLPTSGLAPLPCLALLDFAGCLLHAAQFLSYYFPCFDLRLFKLVHTIKTVPAKAMPRCRLSWGSAT